MMNMLATRYFSLVLETKESISEPDGPQYTRNVRAVIVHLDGLPALSSKLNILITYIF